LAKPFRTRNAHPQKRRSKNEYPIRKPNYSCGKEGLNKAFDKGGHPTHNQVGGRNISGPRWIKTKNKKKKKKVKKKKKQKKKKKKKKKRETKPRIPTHGAPLGQNKQSVKRKVPLDKKGPALQNTWR